MTNLISVEELGRKWRWNEQRIYRLCNQKQIPHVRIGGRIFFREAVLEQWLEAKEQQPTLKTNGVTSTGFALS